MLVHGVWTDEGLAFWAETPADHAALPGVRRRGEQPAPHPFAASAARLAAGLHLDAASAPDLTAGPDVGAAVTSPVPAETRQGAVLGFHRPVGQAVGRTLELLLPGSAREPLPSPETGLLPGVARPRLRRWQVPAVVPSTSETLRLLTALTLSEAPQDRETGAGGSSRSGRDSHGTGAAGRSGTCRAVTATLRHWAAVAGFADGLVRRGRVIPQLVPLENPAGPGMPRDPQDASEAGRRWAAVWRAVVTGGDAAYFRELALAMPPACRAYQAERPASDVLLETLDAFADALVRRALAGRAPAEEPRAREAPGTPEGRWLAALTGADPSCADVPRLREELESWRRTVLAAESAARVCFRLVEPAPEPVPFPEDVPQRDEDGWRVEVALRAADDPSLYVPAARVWTGEPVPGLPRRPERDLLAGLGRAARLYPELERALRVPHPTGLTLDTPGAYGFLRTAAPLLQAAGFGVQLPRWAGRTRLGLKLTTRTASRQGAATGQGFGLRELVDFRVDLAVGDAVISEAELAELARLKVPLVRVRGQWVELDERQLKAALKAVAGRRSGQASAAGILQEVVRGGDEDLPLLEVDADGVLGDLLSGQAERRLAPIATPEGLDATLRPYQERGLAWLSFLSELGLGGVLADDMGLGKTVTTLALLVHERAAEPTLLACPMSLVGNWQREAARFAPDLRVYVHHGQGRDASRVAGADLVITTYGTAQRDLETLRGFAWRRVVCDEAQAIKNSGTLQSRAVRSIPAGTRLALTGTPVENHLAELWSIMEFANPGMLGPRARFRTRFQEPIEARQDERAARELKRATGPFILRRVKTDKSVISDLPEKMEVKEWCPLTAEQATLYRAVVDDMLAKIDASEGIERRGLVLSAMAKLKQVCNHPAHLLKDGSRLAGRSGKLTRLEQLAEEILAEGEKALVFTQYAEFGSMLQPYLAQRLERPVLWLHGGLPKKTRDRLVQRFQDDPEPMLFVLSLKAAGVGLNLTAANHVVHVDRWWNPAVEDQATDRAFRIGQRRNVQVRKLICAGTLEERVDAMIERKKALAERVVGTGEEWLTDLSTAELREVFRLTGEA
ncbi:DEAD/DEAH box helicase [Nonomuraea pusilla]|uniref:DEAD/DEAH box helicase n=1 Tax=Nonomuraea pusilla TaxID=46177 RepID=UPI00332A431B